MNYLDDVMKPNQSVNPLFSMLGVTIHRIDKTGAVLHLPFKRDLLQGGGVIAGGILSTLLDEAMAHAVLARLKPDCKTATIDLNVQYLAPAKSENELLATPRVIKQGSRVLFTESEMTCGAKPVAIATASFLVNTNQSLLER